MNFFALKINAKRNNGEYLIYFYNIYKKLTKTQLSLKEVAFVITQCNSGIEMKSKLKF